MENGEQSHIDRRRFLKQTVLYAVAVTTLHGFDSCSEKHPPGEIIPECKTTDDILGPFYKSGAPMQENIIPLSGTTADALIVRGQALSNCNTPVKDAVVEIWNANEKGEYDTSSEFKFRGKYQTSDDGNYQFKTIVPGKYLNGNTYRPSHIHFRITAPGHRELISQIYFKDDPYIASDPWASAPKASERVLIIEKNADNIDVVNFNIYLTRV
jgi:protocatechuate 3,4-dioxygenase beta subunit